MGGSNAGLFALLKQQAGHAEVDASPSALTGISSFAFQGTNAHVLLGGSTSSQSADHRAAGPLSWERQFTSVLPAAHAQLQSAVTQAGGKRMALEMHLGQHALQAFFCDHQVSGKLIFPGGLDAQGCALALSTYSLSHASAIQALDTWRWQSQRRSACCMGVRPAAPWWAQQSSRRSSCRAQQQNLRLLQPSCCAPMSRALRAPAS